MKKSRSGFTLIEVVLFLAITGVLFIGVIGGVQTSLTQQQNDDSVYSFMEFLKGLYSKVANVQNNIGGGMSDKVIYGKLVTFGEEQNLLGENNWSGRNYNSIFVYTVIGDEVKTTGTQGSLTLLSKAKANVKLESNEGIGELAGLVDTYAPKWEMEIQPACEVENDVWDCEESLSKPWTGSLLIVQHPTSGNIETYYSNQVVSVNGTAEEDPSANPFGMREEVATSGALKKLSNIDRWDFKMQQIDFCLNVSGDKTKNDKRYDVRIMKGAHSAFGVELVPDNSAEGMEGENLCKK